MTQSHQYSFPKIFAAIISIILGVFFVISQENYDNYCLCNLQLIDDKPDLSDNYGTKTFENNAFGLYYNASAKSTKVMYALPGHPARYSLDKVLKIINEFKYQKNMTDDEFKQWVNKRTYNPLPNIPCYFILEKFSKNLKQRNMKYGCVDIPYFPV